MLDEFTAQVRRGKRCYVVTALRGVDGPHVANVANADGTFRNRFEFPRGRRRGEKFSTSLAEVAVDQFVDWIREAARAKRLREFRVNGLPRRSTTAAAE